MLGHGPIGMVVNRLTLRFETPAVCSLFMGGECVVRLRHSSKAAVIAFWKRSKFQS